MSGLAKFQVRMLLSKEFVAEVSIEKAVSSGMIRGPEGQLAERVTWYRVDWRQLPMQDQPPAGYDWYIFEGYAEPAATNLAKESPEALDT